MPPATVRSGHAHGSSSAAMSEAQQRRRRRWTAIDDCQGQIQKESRKRKSRRAYSWLLLLLLQRTHSFLRLAQVIQGKPAGFNQMSHHRLRASAEQTQQFVNQPALGGMARDNRLKDVRVADLLYAPHYFFLFHAVHGGLDGGVCGA